MKSFLKKIIPQSWILAYHYLLSELAALAYWFPSRKMVVIGVTGTNGKSTTVNLIAKILEEAGHKVGLISTVNFKIGNREQLNNLKMTMPGRFLLQRMLRQMVRAGCRYAVIETSSEGILQYRHLSIDYDVVVFTNLTPEHLEAHGGFDNYKKTKLRLPAHVASGAHKRIDGKTVKKILVANLDDHHALDFLDFDVDERWGYRMDKLTPEEEQRTRERQIKFTEVIKLDQWKVGSEGVSFSIREYKFNLKLLGLFDLFNTGVSLTCARALGIDWVVIKRALEKVGGIPGRMEKIDLGQPFTVMVDYSPEPASLTAVYKTVLSWPYAKIVHVLGSTGGGRDKQRRSILGYIAGTNAGVVIVTNEDPYDDDPNIIIDDVAMGAQEAGKEDEVNLFKILDRREAIGRAFQLAKPRDLVLITGKGSEQAMVVRHSVKIPWDDRVVAREELKKLGYKK